MKTRSVFRLGDFAESIDYGVTASAYNRPVGPKFLRITDIQDGVVDWDTVPWCECDVRSASDAQLKSGDILFARTGATTGKSYLIRECPADAVFASYLIRVRVGNAADPRFVSWYFHTPDYWAQITKSARGVAQPGVNATTLKELKIPLPPLPEQRRIAAILDKADNLRAKRRAALAQLDTLTQSIFLDMFGDPATNPKGWPRKQIGQVATVITGNTPSRAISEYYGDTIEWIKSDNINTPHYFLTQADERLSAMGRQVAWVAPAGSILGTCIAGSPACIGNSSMTDGRWHSINRSMPSFRSKGTDTSSTASSASASVSSSRPRRRQ